MQQFQVPDHMPTSAMYNSQVIEIFQFSAFFILCTVFIADECPKFLRAFEMVIVFNEQSFAESVGWIKHFNKENCIIIFLLKSF